jgi:hypothetical protein
MRRSTLVLTAVGVSAAAITGSAFTASNTMPAGAQYAGYGSVTVSGVTVTHVTYNPLAGASDKVDSIVFTVNTPTPALSGTTEQAKLTLKDSVPSVIGSYVCTFGADSSGSQDITCSTGTPDAGGTTNPLFSNVVTVGLSVSNKS